MDNTLNQIIQLLEEPAISTSPLIELLGIVRNSSGKYDRFGYYVENGVMVNCTKKSTTAEYAEYVFGIYLVICLFIFSMMIRRVSFHKDKCNGRPGLVLPMNMLNSHDYIIEYTLIFLAFAEEIYNFIFGLKAEFGITLPIVKFFVKLVLVVVVSIFTYPIFAAICNRHLIWYFAVLVAIIAYFGVGLSNTYISFYCIMGTKIVPLLIIAIIYSGIEVSVICLFLWKIVNYIRRNGFVIKEAKLYKNQVYECSLWYVKELFKEKVPINSKTEEELENNEGGVKVILKQFQCNEMRMKIKEKFYRQIPGFSLPPRLIIGIFVGLYFSYRIFINEIYDITPMAWNLINNLNDKYPTTELNLKSSFEIVSGNYSLYSINTIRNAYRFLIFFYAHLFIGCIAASISIAFVNSIIQTFLLLRNYRLDFHNITRKGFSSIMDIKTAPEPHGLVIGFVRYSGYQAAYTMWGILIVMGFVFAILYFLVGIFLLPLFYLENSWARRFVVNYGPVIAVSIIFNFIQGLIVKHFFVKEHGKLMEVDNRKAFMIYTHCAFFLNAMTGLFNSLKRIIVWIFTGIFTFSRIDISCLPEYLNGFDGGYMTYIGFLYTEQYHYNPILQCFSHILLESAERQGDSKSILLTKSDKERESLRYRNLWNVAVTLINNPILLTERKLFLQRNPMPD